MDARIKSIQLQNRTPTRKRGRKARRPHKKRRRPTHGRRQKTHSKRGNLTTKGSILGHPRDRRNQDQHIGNNRILRQGRRRNIESQQKRQRNPGYQKNPGRREERNEGNSTMAMSMEGRPLMVSRKELDTKRRRDSNSSYIRKMS